MDLLSSLGLAPVQAEDVVHVAIYPDDSQQDLQLLLVECTQLLLPLTQGYIWQKDRLLFHRSDDEPPPWTVSRAGKKKGRATPPQDPSHPPCLWASLRFGDNIEDEWFVVFLIKTLTQQLPTSTSARVWDNDGEFLLIEAAHALPKWLKPETSENRLWWRRGQLVLIPPPSKKWPSLPPFPSLVQALELVREGVNAVQVQQISKAVEQRLSSYSPSCTTPHMHWTRCTVPLRVAHILRQDPQLVAPAVEAFYYRDPASIKAARRMQHFPPTDMVTCMVRLNRCMYAQLKQQQFHAPKGFPMPLDSSPDFAAADLGLKLTFGCEAVYQEASRHKGGVSREPAGAEPVAMSGPEITIRQLSSNPAWCSYLASLERGGYFQGNIPGSQSHSQLLSHAQQAFVKTQLYHQSTEALSTPAVRMDEILQESISPDVFGPETVFEADSDAWMMAEGLRLEEELNAREAEWDAYTQKKKHKAGDGPVPPAPGAGAAPGPLDAAGLAHAMHQFVEHMSGLEGVEVPTGAGGRINMSSKSLWDELCGALGATHLASHGRSGSKVSGTDRPTKGGLGHLGYDGDDHDDDEDDDMSSGSYTTSEGSSFFDGSDNLEEDDREVGTESSSRDTSDRDEDTDSEEESNGAGDNFDNNGSVDGGRGVGGKESRGGGRRVVEESAGGEVQIDRTGGGSVVKEAKSDDVAQSICVVGGSDGGGAGGAGKIGGQSDVAEINGDARKAVVDEAVAGRATTVGDGGGVSCDVGVVEHENRKRVMESRSGVRRGFLNRSKAENGRAVGTQAPGPALAKPVSVHVEERTELSTAGQAGFHASGRSQIHKPGLEHVDKGKPGVGYVEKPDLHFENTDLRSVAARGVDPADVSAARERPADSANSGLDPAGKPGLASQVRSHEPGATPPYEPGQKPAATLDNVGRSRPSSSGQHAQHTDQDDAGWEVQTATDSDDAVSSDAGDRDGSMYDMDDFAEMYDQALNSELAGTTMAQSFETVDARGTSTAAPSSYPPGAGATSELRMPPHSSGSVSAGVRLESESRQGNGKQAGGGKGKQDRAGQQGGGLTPVDVDVNLVKSLLRSHAEQCGLPGPVGGLLGMLGVQLPPETRQPMEE